MKLGPVSSYFAMVNKLAKNTQADVTLVRAWFCEAIMYVGGELHM